MFALAELQFGVHFIEFTQILSIEDEIGLFVVRLTDSDTIFALLLKLMTDLQYLHDVGCALGIFAPLVDEILASQLFHIGGVHAMHLNYFPCEFILHNFLITVLGDGEPMVPLVEPRGSWLCLITHHYYYIKHQ